MIKFFEKNILNIILIPCFLFFLTQCSTHRYPVEGIARSYKSYYVQGQWHHPQKCYDYDKTGLASWYGPGFHGAKKAQGEVYNQYSMTAAHKTLPLPTIVKVTNLKNGKNIVVLVDDRGPFKYKGRIIDLSISAAKELGTYANGVGKVRVQSLPKESNAFALYLKNNCGNVGLNTSGKTWEQIYREKIGSKSGYQNLTFISSRTHESNKTDISKSKSSQKKVRNKRYTSINKYILQCTSKKRKAIHR